MVSFQDLSCTEVLQPALSFCDALSLAAVQATSSSFARGLLRSSPLWSNLLHLSGMRLVGMEAPECNMAQCLRLARAIARCVPRLARDDVLDDQATEGRDRHRLVVSGARSSGISTLVRMLIRGPQTIDQMTPTGPRVDLEVYNLREELDGIRVKASVVDKRSTAITTPLSASLYQGDTVVVFVFDAARMEASLIETAQCIRDVHHTVGEAKFDSMPKFLVCHKAELLHAEGVPTTCGGALAESFPPMCEELLQAFGMHLVLTTVYEQESSDRLLALVSEQWPRRERVVAGAKEIPVVTADDPEHTFTSVGERTRRPQPLPRTILEELQAARRRAE